MKYSIERTGKKCTRSFLIGYFVVRNHLIGRKTMIDNLRHAWSRCPAGKWFTGNVVIRTRSFPVHDWAVVSEYCSVTAGRTGIQAKDSSGESYIIVF